jgi:hypothetical protein
MFDGVLCKDTFLVVTIMSDLIIETSQDLLKNVPTDKLSPLSPLSEDEHMGTETIPQNPDEDDRKRSPSTESAIIDHTKKKGSIKSPRGVYEIGDCVNYYTYLCLILTLYSGNMRCTSSGRR